MAELILVVDDEQDLLTTLEYNLQQQGYQTVSALTGQGALARVEKGPIPDLVVLDLMLPDIAGSEVCRRLRAGERTEHVPIIMLTAKGSEIDRVVGFEVGADDYVVKPFSVHELMLRIRAILKRAQPRSSDDVLSFDRLRVDRSGHRVWVDHKEVTLTALEFRLLATFLERKGRVQSRDALLSDVWGIQAEVTTRTVDTHVNACGKNSELPENTSKLYAGSDIASVNESPTNRVGSPGPQVQLEMTDQQVSGLGQKQNLAVFAPCRN